MKIRNWLFLIVGLVSGMALNAIAQQNNQPSRQVSEFAIQLTVDRDANGISVKCLEGCLWRTLSFHCGPDKPDCEGTFDEGGTPAI